MNRINYWDYIEKNTLRLEAGYRGGGLEVDCYELTKVNGAKCAVYQNYLGGGMLGCICYNQNFETNDKRKLGQLEFIEAIFERLY